MLWVSMRKNQKLQILQYNVKNGTSITIIFKVYQYIGLKVQKCIRKVIAKGASNDWGRWWLKRIQGRKGDLGKCWETGCTGLVKHSQHTDWQSYMFAKYWAQSGTRRTHSPICYQTPHSILPSAQAVYYTQSIPLRVYLLFVQCKSRTALVNTKRLSRAPVRYNGFLSVVNIKRICTDCIQLSAFSQPSPSSLKPKQFI